MKKKALALFLAVMILLAPCVNVYADTAAAGQNAQVEAARIALEKKFNITIRYDVDPDGAASIGTGTLATMDGTLSAITPEVISQISEYYRKTRGSRINVSFVYSPYQSMGYGFDVLGSFDPETAKVEYYIPAYGRDVLMPGDSPITIAHEFGHAFHIMFAEQYGEARLEREWTSLNGGVRYRGDYVDEDYNKSVFISNYGSTTYEEDFAEVFAHCFVRHKTGLGFSYLLKKDGKATALGAKVNYLEKMLPVYLTNIKQAQTNFQRLYSTGVYLEYQGLRLTGEYLQFIGCAYPRYILRSILQEIGLEAQESQWIIEVGGWKVTAADRRVYLIFPGGQWTRIGDTQAAAA